MHIHRKHLKQKGWDEGEIEQARTIIKKAEKSRHPHNILLEKLTFYVCLFIAMAGNYLISVMLIPLLLAFSKLTLDIILIIIGLSFGTLFTVLIQELIHVQKHHKYLYLIVPAVAMLNIYLMVSRINGLAELAQDIKHNPLILALIYALSFTAPYIYFLLERYDL